MNAAPDGILLTDRDGTILMANEAMEAISGYSAEQLLGQSVSIFLQPYLRERHSEHMRSYFQSPAKRAMGMARDLWLVRQDGSTIPVDVALGYSDAHGGTAVAFVRDISEVRQLQTNMHYQATHDTLTGLVNRWQFGQRLEQAIIESARHGQPFALLLLDLDDFKTINDSYGHAAGDKALLEVARRLKGVLRSVDTLARLGGDEFTVLLTHLGQPDDAKKVAAKLLAALQLPCQINGFDVNLGASVGIAIFPGDAPDAATLMRYADIAMYHAKEHGRANFVQYAPAMGQKMSEKILLHDRLKAAMAKDELVLHYQPQIDVATGRMVAVEALLRWNDPELGAIGPDRFIPVAETTGLILPLGAWVLKTACRQAAEWARAGAPLRIAVNLSAQQLRQADLVNMLRAQLLGHKVPHGLLELEITESEAMADPEQARQLLTGLQALGVGVTLDDFGTGHSSLSYLKLLPVTRIKIDRGFIQPILHNEADATLVRAVIALAHTLGLQVVAEGVEEVEQLRFLEQHRCDTIQGWLYSRAVPAKEITLLQAASAPFAFTHA